MRTCEALLLHVEHLLHTGSKGRIRAKKICNVLLSSVLRLHLEQKTVHGPDADVPIMTWWIGITRGLAAVWKELQMSRWGANGGVGK
eukprot:CAMPEP_0176464332 /NCGR_PEP_ID=MMETSP0127-20121128/36460_1 /TAXON_ID=938130 /ORGANISM="Platyophrya macrostoma, Strain WH" /LENGTH=86 /DNA_ID=CAMNT_0017856741 /DNA_START=276 /DNA_END=536 /DNA_ORIENTATION=+